MKIKAKLFLILTFLFIFFYIFPVPEKADVDKAVKKEIENQIKINKRLALLGDMIRKIFNKAPNNVFKIIFDIIIVFVIAVIVFSIIYFILRSISSRQYLENKTKNLKINNQEIVFDKKYLNELLSDKEYSLAVLYLHRCSIYYLIKNKITYNKNLTNYSLCIKIKDPEMKEAFKGIYSLSEKILFDSYNASYDDINQCKEIYFNNFTGH